jgi:hypothetical protein
MLVVLRDHVRFVFNRTEGKLEIVVLKEYECNWAIEVNF